MSATAFLTLALAILLSTSLDITIGLLFLLGCTIPGIMAVGYLYACELLSPDQRRIFNLLYSFFETLTNVLAVLAYWLVDNNYFWISAVQFGLVIFTFLFLLVPESPMWLLTSGRQS